MKKVLSFIIVLFLTIVFISNVKAKSNELEVTNVEIIEKSDQVKANIEEYKDLSINLNTLFFSKDDYVKYKITIKNNTKNTMKIDDILDNFNSEVLETSYDIEKKELKSNEEYTFTLTIKCIKDIEEEKVTITSPLNIIINYDNGKTATIDINPDTKDSIITYFIIFVLSGISLFLVITKKGKKQLLGLMLIVSLIPITSNAVSTSKTITINNNIKVYGNIATIDNGSISNKKLKDIAGTDTSVSENAYSVADTNIVKILRADSLPDDFISNEDNTISTDYSKLPIYVWFENGILYYYTESEKILLNENCNRLFQNMTSLEEIDLSSFDTSNVIFMGSMFGNCTNLKKLDLSNFDTSNVTVMGGMFQKCLNLEEIDLSSFDTSKVTDMSYMFNNCFKLREIDLSNFDTSNVTTMKTMFQNCSLLEQLDLGNFNTSKVTDMSYMFNNCSSLNNLDISNFDTSNVSNMRSMFSSCVLLEELDTSNFNTNNVTNMSYMFYECKKLKSINVTNFDTSNVTTMKSMFYDCQTLEELDLSSFSTINVNIMAYMFNKTTSLNTIYVSDKFVTDNVSDSSYMFYNNINLVGGNGTTFSNSYKDKTYARIDTEESPGYFTLKSA